MLDFNTFDWTLALSLSALTLSKIALYTAEEQAMSAISAISAIIFCLTALIKFIDLVIEKYHKWKKPKSED
jgi:hypothetical protein